MRKASIKLCQFPGCQKQGIFGMYQLKGDETKKWHLFCNDHEKEIVKQNARVREVYPDIVRYYDVDMKEIN